MAKRKAFTLSEKIDFIKKYDENPNLSKVALAQELRIPASTLKTIISKRDEIVKSAGEAGVYSAKKSRVKKCKYESVEKPLAQWFSQARAQNLPVSGPILCEKAKEIGLQVQVSESFSASDGWLRNFRKRNGIVCKNVSGESESVDMETVDDWKSTKLPDLIRYYDSKDIYNADETGLFFNLLPNRTLTFKDDPCHGGKKSKERVTVLLAVNADGSEKLPPLVIGKFQKPRCFKNNRILPTKYTFNKKAWMTTCVFEDWLHALDAKMGARNRNILLFVDQCSAHPKHMSLRNVKVVFFPANCTSVLQPLDLGIIQALKMSYKKMLLQKMLREMDRVGCLEKPKVDLLQVRLFVL